MNWIKKHKILSVIIAIFIIAIIIPSNDSKESETDIQKENEEIVEEQVEVTEEALVEEESAKLSIETKIDSGEVTISILTSDYNETSGHFIADVLINGDVTEDEIVEIAKYHGKNGKSAVVRGWTSMEAFNDDTMTSQAAKEGYMFYYIKSMERAGEIKHEVRWFQEIGKFSHLYGTTTEISDNEEVKKTSEVSLSGIDYKIVETDDVSFGDTKRLSVKVLLKNNPATEDQIKAISEKVVSDNEDNYHAISVSFYFDESQVNGAYTLAQATWAPDGDWSKADQKTGQRFAYDFKEFVGKERTGGPTVLEREISDAIVVELARMRESNPVAMEREAAEALAAKYAKTTDEMMDIRMDVYLYDSGF